MTGVVNTLVSPDHMCWGKDIPTVVNLDNAAEEGFDQYRYVLS